MVGPQGAEAIIPVPLQGQFSFIFVCYSVVYEATALSALISNYV